MVFRVAQHPYRVREWGTWAQDGGGKGGVVARCRVAGVKLDLLACERH